MDIKGRAHIKIIFTEKGFNTMNYNMMSGAGGGSMMVLAWLTYILFTALLVLGIAALYKYLTKK